MSLTVEEFTTPDPLTAKEDASLENLTRVMSERGVRHLPILRGEQIVGVVSDRDLRIASGLTQREKSQVKAGDIMAANPVTVTTDSPLDEVALLMSEKKIGSVIVCDEDDKLYGIFTATDALNALIEIARSLEDR